MIGSLIVIFLIPNMSVKHWLLLIPIKYKNLEQSVGSLKGNLSIDTTFDPS